LTLILDDLSLDDDFFSDFEDFSLELDEVGLGPSLVKISDFLAFFGTDVLLGGSIFLVDPFSFFLLSLSFFFFSALLPEEDLDELVALVVVSGVRGDFDIELIFSTFRVELLSCLLLLSLPLSLSFDFETPSLEPSLFDPFLLGIFVGAVLVLLLELDEVTEVEEDCCAGSIGALFDDRLIGVPNRFSNAFFGLTLAEPAALAGFDFPPPE
jgi:hypothetical protein